MVLMLEECEGMEMHHEPAGSPLADHYARVVTVLSHAEERLKWLDHTRAKS